MMPITGAITYTGFRVFLTAGVLNLNLFVPEPQTTQSLFTALMPNVGVSVDADAQEGGKEFADLLTAHAEQFRQFVGENLPNRMALVGLIIMEGGLVHRASGEVEFSGEFRRPTPEDYAAFDTFLLETDVIVAASLAEHCKVCSTCAEMEGLPIPEGAVPHNMEGMDFDIPAPWQGNPTDDDIVH